MNPTDSQRECIEDVYRMTSAVSAGAGSGKTATLTARIVYALSHPDISGVEDIENILVITYTNKAANELKSRIKGALEAAGMGEQALKVDGAWISTIHGMCSRILKENAFTFGVDPAYAILSDEVRSKLIDDAIEAVLINPVDDEDKARKADLFKEFGREEVKSSVAQLIEMASDHNGALRDFFIMPKAVDPYDCLFELLRLCFEFAERCENGGKTAVGYHGACMAALRRLIGIDQPELTFDDVSAWYSSLDKSNPQEALALAAKLAKPSGNFGKIAEDPLSDTSEKPITAIDRCATDLRLSIQRPRLEALIEVAQQARDLFAERKRKLGVMDNDDLIATAAFSLSDPRNSGIKQRYNDQFGLVMIDEFQDTNQVQVDMINLIAGGSADKMSDKMCVVGDAQQSIYRFRNADLEVFREHIRQVEAASKAGKGKVISFQENFRSHGEILAFSKEVFQRTFDKDTYLELLHGRDETSVEAKHPFKGACGEPGESPEDVPRRINLCMFTDAGKKGITKYAAQAIARDFAKLVERGHRPGDMALLLGRMGNAGVYASALEEAGLHCAITGGSVFKDTPEAKVVINLCYALSNPMHTSALADVLTSDLFCLNAEDLLSMASVDIPHGGGRAKLTTPIVGLASGSVTTDEIKDLGLTEAALAAVKVLARAMSHVGTQPLSALVEQVLVDSGWVSRENGKDTVKAGNVFKAMRMLSEVEKSEHIDALALARHLDLRISELKEPPGVLSATGDDFVRIMTIHSSKGLQFPIVAVSEADYRTPTRGHLESITLVGKTYLALGSGASLDEFSDKTLLKLSSSRKDNLTESIDADEFMRMTVSPKHVSDSLLGIAGSNDIAQRNEHQRKLYVAYTRAEDALIVAFKEPSKPDEKVPDALDAIEEIIGKRADEGEGAQEDGGASEAQKSSQTSLVDIHTEYAGHPEKTIDWTIRLDTLSLEDKPEEAPSADEFADDAHEPIRDDLTESRKRHLPSGPASQQLQSVPYRSSWAEGIISASSLKHESETGQAQVRFNSVVVDDDDEPRASAAERGTAFHSLGEWSASRRLKDGTLPVPPQERFEAIARTYGLSASQTEALAKSFGRWLASESAYEAVAHKVVCPEAPFYVKLDEPRDERSALVIDGFIDLLCYDEFGKGSAFVVDYKTGTFLADDQSRRDAYEVQAKTYAYALLLQGFTDVRLDFVFVDQPDERDASKASVTTFPKPGDPSYTLEALRADLIAAATT